MDLRTYYRKIREAEATLPEGDIVLVSLASVEGGKPDVRTEAPKAVAAKFIAEGRARAATSEEAAEFRARMRTAQEDFEADQAARRVQVVVMPNAAVSKRRQGLKEQE